LKLTDREQKMLVRIGDRIVRIHPHGFDLETYIPTSSVLKDKRADGALIACLHRKGAILVYKGGATPGCRPNTPCVQLTRNGRNMYRFLAELHSQPEAMLVPSTFPAEHTPSDVTATLVADVNGTAVADPVPSTPTPAATPTACSKPLSILDAAFEVLRHVPGGKTCREIVSDMAEQRLWRSHAATPERTLFSAFLHECKSKDCPRFRKVGRGLWEARK
jgi:HB1, ASXL, restriction endonuclease HTH domain